MARIEIEYPEGKTVFSHKLPVRIGDENYFGHLGHDSLIKLIHEARARFFTGLGHHEGDTNGFSCIVSDLAVMYRSEAHYPQVLEVEIAPGDIGSHRCELYYRVSQADTKKVVGLAKTGHVFFLGHEAKLQRIPEVFLEGLGID